MIKIQCFAHLKEQLGSAEVTIEKNEMTVEALLDELATTYQLDTSAVLVAINEEYSLPEDIVKSTDSVALIPPVSGG